MTPPIALPWLRYVRQSSQRGACWVREYERLLPVQQTCQDAVAVLRRRGLDAGDSLLSQARAALHRVPRCSPSVRAVADRWYWGAVAFYHYAREEWTEAHTCMDRAHAAVVAALEDEQCLMPIAVDCYEFEMHRARIARSSRDWLALHCHVDAAMAMRIGKAPFCSLSDGTRIGLHDIQGYFRLLPELNEEDHQLLRPLLDDDQSRLTAERSVRALLRLPGFVIVYP